MDYFTTNKLPVMALENLLLEFQVLRMMEIPYYEKLYFLAAGIEASS